MLKYGSDKPDLRFGLEIQDATEATRDSEFAIFAGAPIVRFLVVPRELSRGDLAKLETIAKEWGAKGLAYLVVGADGEVRSPIAKFLSKAELDAVGAPAGSTVLFAADEKAAVERVLGALRLHLGRELDLVDESREAFHWILDFPMFQLDDETGRWTFVHHPFTGALDGHEDLIESDPEHALSQHYDLIWNGWELGSGSIRIHRSDVQERVFRAMGMSQEEAEAKFGWFLKALEMGAPPHGGFALGLDRFVALLAGRAEHSRGHRVPEGVQRIRPPDGRTGARARRPAPRARHPARREALLSGQPARASLLRRPIPTRRAIPKRS